MHAFTPIPIPAVGNVSLLVLDPSHTTLLESCKVIERILTVVGHSPLPCSLDHFTFGTQEIGSVYDILKRPLARRVLFSACRISGNSVTRISNLKKWFYKHAATIEYSNDNMGVLGRLLPLSFVPLLVLAASDPFVDGLNQLGLTSFAKLILAISQTKLGATLVQQLMTSTNYSIFVPTNEALAELDSNSTQDTNLVARHRLISRH
ncbi:hypothetical protein MPER_10752 [Moniliophthora perniciosa FA553]|nr:hypothetical protein MPER_10752 [Moniliophthora perniciosa FA553]